MNSQEVLFETLTGPHGEIGVITLNRPDSLNALNLAMCLAIDQQLGIWEQTSTIKAVVIRGAGERAFCAGGDVRRIYETRHQTHEAGREFFAHEYRLNRRIHHYTKPYIAFLDGISMGGGLGLSIHGSHRIGTERLKLAMPETGIGFFPDVGGSHFLTRCPGKLGWYLGLTGTVCDVANARYADLVDAVVPSHCLDDLLAALVQADWSQDASAVIHTTISTYAAMEQLPASLATHRTVLDHCFSQPTIEAVLQRLAQHQDDWSQQTFNILQQRSPTSLKVTLALLNRAVHLDFDAAIQQEYVVTQQFLESADFYEGIRAAVIDKDRTPHWQPESLSVVSIEQVEAYFQRENRVALLPV